ncbi:MAG: hypothetical protein IT244_11790 [Bacteroidia bacterium]|nr:hypothetical protein [Bacteroidia bacterium]
MTRQIFSILCFLAILSYLGADIFPIAASITVSHGIFLKHQIFYKAQYNNEIGFETVAFFAVFLFFSNEHGAICI